MEAYSAADIANFKLLFNPTKAEDLTGFGVPKELTTDCILRCHDRIKDRMKYKPLDIEKLIKEGMINM